MKKLTKSLYSAVAVAALTVAFAGNAKAEINPINGNNLFFISGHAEAGIYKNQYWNDDPVAVQNTRDDLQFNQGVIAVGKKLDKTKTFDVGGRIDYMFGTDARLVQSDGLERNSKTKNGERGWGTGDYFSAISQMYVEAKYDAVNVKAGKMLNPMGHESIYSTDRFFYSLSNAYNLRPATISGIVANWDINSQLNVYGGWASSADQTFDSSQNQTLLAGVGYKVNNQLGLKFGVMHEFEDGATPNARNTSVNAIASYAINSKMDYTFELTYAQARERSSVATVSSEIRAYSYNNELIYKFNKEFSMGGRFEYVHYYDNASKNSSDLYSLTVGANYSPIEYVTIKPEVRYDRVGSDRIFEHGNNGKKDQFSAGVSAVVKF